MEILEGRRKSSTKKMAREDTSHGDHLPYNIILRVFVTQHR
jgi:hypothetical protein